MTEYRRGLIASRKNLWIARIAAERFLRCASDDHDGLLLYGGSFFVFLRSALFALKESDGRDDARLKTISDTYFNTHIKPSDVYKAINAERQGIAHGNDSYALHPFKPQGLLDRADVQYGIAWDEIVFEDTWPFPPLRGQAVSDVINIFWRQVSNWLDEIDILDEQDWKAKFGEQV